MITEEKYAEELVDKMHFPGMSRGNAIQCALEAIEAIIYSNPTVVKGSIFIPIPNAKYFETVKQIIKNKQ